MQKLITLFEIPTTDFRRAVDFYETVLGYPFNFECETRNGLFHQKVKPWC